MSIASRLSRLVQSEAFDWGDSVAEAYHGAAAAHMDAHWETIIWPILSRYDPDLSVVMDFACGRGRNALRLKQQGAADVTLVDVNPENIAYCDAQLAPLGGFRTFLNDGFSLTGLRSERFTLLYSFDAMVHFDLEVVVAYVPEFARVLRPGGLAFIHHSNYTANPGGSFRDNPHWRGFMSADILRHLALRNGFDVLEQTPLEWDGQALDSISVLRRV